MSGVLVGLSDIGDVPYTLAAPFLAQCSAVQLGDIELRSPVSPHISSFERSFLLSPPRPVMMS